MNPSYNSGGANVPGVKPGTIASGPAPSNGNVPGVRPGTIASGPASTGSAMPAGGSMSAGGAMPAQPQQDRYIPPRSMNPTPVMPMSGGASRKPKKGIIIGGILVVVALVFGIAAVVLMPKGGGGNIQTIATENIDYYKYANYILYGNDTANSDLGEFDSSYDYAVTLAFGDKNENFFEKAKNLWNDFYERIDKDENISEVSSLRGGVDWQNELLDFLTRYVAMENYTEEELFSLYASSGYDKAIDTIEKNYQKMNGVSYEAGAKYTDSLFELAKMILTMYAEYDSHNCISNEEINNACMKDESILSSDLIERYRQAEDAVYVNEMDLNEVLDDLVKSCFRIRNVLGGEQDEE